jgi:hypothetical protein
MSDISQLKVYSVGIVAANKSLNSHDIEATPIENTSMLDGELTDNVVQTHSKATDASGAAYETQVPATATVKATWLPLEGGGNRLTAPDVRRGERVILYRFADEDRFWWVTQGQDMRLRKLETVIWGISASREESDGINPEKMYWMEWSTHKKMIHLHTSRADGEPFAYDIQLNTKDGTLVIQDDDGQQLSLDSRERIWQIINRDGSKVEVNKREIFLHAEDRIRITTQRLEQIVGEHIETQAPTTHIESTTVHDGDQTINGELTVSGAISSGASVMAAGDVTAGGKSLQQHTHQEQGDGSATSPPL